jgi:hypothetical protein
LAAAKEPLKTAGLLAALHKHIKLGPSDTAHGQVICRAVYHDHARGRRRFSQPGGGFLGAAHL